MSSRIALLRAVGLQFGLQSPTSAPELGETSPALRPLALHRVIAAGRLREEATSRINDADDSPVDHPNAERRHRLALAVVVDGPAGALCAPLSALAHSSPLIIRFMYPRRRVPTVS